MILIKVILAIGLVPIGEDLLVQCRTRTWPPFQPSTRARIKKAGLIPKLMTRSRLFGNSRGNGREVSKLAPRSRIVLDDRLQPPLKFAP